MWFKYCVLLCTALAAAAVKVDLLGSLTLGSEVAEFLTQYLHDDVVKSVSGRRAMTDALEELIKVARHIQPCKNLHICSVNLEKLLTDYVSALMTCVKTVFSVLEDELCKVRYFQKCLKHFKNVVGNATEDSDEVYRWINVVKRISGSFIEQSLQLTGVGLEKVARRELATNALRQQLVFKVIDVEKEYLEKLCKEFSFCPYQYGATIHLQLLLNMFKNTNDTNLKLFLNLFRQKFLRSPVLAEDTATLKRFDDVLKEMVLESSVSAKDIVLSISDVVQKRLSGTESTAKDAALLHVILADMDHIYVNNYDEPVETFLDSVKGWMKTNDLDALGKGMEAFYNALSTHFSNQPDELVIKLKTEAHVFLDLSLDPTSAR